MASNLNFKLKNKVGSSLNQNSDYVKTLSPRQSQVIGAIPCGFMVDSFGPAVCAGLHGLVFTLGFLFLGLSADDGMDGFAVGCILVGFGGSF